MHSDDKSCGSQDQAAPGAWCGDCGRGLGDARHLHDGELVCPPCWFKLRLAEERDHLEEFRVEVIGVDFELARAEEAFQAEMARLGRLKATWVRRIGQAERKIAAIEAEAAEPIPTDGLMPIAGGGDYEPTPEDLADYRAWCWDLERRRDEEEMRAEPEAPYGYE